MQIVQAMDVVYGPPPAPRTAEFFEFIIKYWMYLFIPFVIFIGVFSIIRRRRKT